MANLICVFFCVESESAYIHYSTDYLLMMPTGRLAHQQQFLWFSIILLLFFTIIQWHCFIEKKRRSNFVWWWNESIEINWEHFVFKINNNDWYCSFSESVMRVDHDHMYAVYVGFNVCLCVSTSIFFCVCISKMHQFFFSTISNTCCKFFCYSIIINNRIWLKNGRPSRREMNTQQKYMFKWLNGEKKIWIKNRYQDILLLFMIVVLRSMYCIVLVSFLIFFWAFFGWAQHKYICEILVAGRLLHVWAVNWPRNIMQDTLTHTHTRIVFNGNRWFSYIHLFHNSFLQFNHSLYCVWNFIFNITHVHSLVR